MDDKSEEAVDAFILRMERKDCRDLLMADPNHQGDEDARGQRWFAYLDGFYKQEMAAAPVTDHTAIEQAFWAALGHDQPLNEPPKEPKEAAGSSGLQDRTKLSDDLALWQASCTLAVRSLPDGRLSKYASDASTSKVNADDEDDCIICMEPLTAKRSVTLDECGHKFHRTCCLDWLATFSTRQGRSCPHCRTRVESAIGENNRMPVVEYICAVWTSTPHSRVDRVLLHLKDMFRQEVGVIEKQRVDAIRDGRPVKYVRDIDYEKQMIQQRIKDFAEVQSYFRDIYELVWMRHWSGVSLGIDLPLFSGNYENDQTALDVLKIAIEQDVLGDLRRDRYRWIVAQSYRAGAALREREARERPPPIQLNFVYTEADGASYRVVEVNDEEAGEPDGIMEERVYLLRQNVIIVRPQSRTRFPEDNHWPLPLPRQFTTRPNVSMDVHLEIGDDGVAIFRENPDLEGAITDPDVVETILEAAIARQAEVAAAHAASRRSSRKRRHPERYVSNT